MKFDKLKKAKYDETKVENYSKARREYPRKGNETTGAILYIPSKGKLKCETYMLWCSRTLAACVGGEL